MTSVGSLPRRGSGEPEGDRGLSVDIFRHYPNRLVLLTSRLAGGSASGVLARRPDNRHSGQRGVPAHPSVEEAR